MQFDSVHGRPAYTVNALDKESLEIKNSNGEVINTIKSLAQKVHPTELPWKELGVEIVLECTGAFTKKADAIGHITAGAKKVIISAPSDSDIKTILIGVNDNQYNGEEIISNASCTTNCLGPIIHVLLKEGIGLKEGLMTTAHAYTASQQIVDGSSKKDFRNGRAAALNIIPATTGAALAIGSVIPEVLGKLTGMAFRVPVANVSVIDLTFKPEKETSLLEINSLMKKASETYLKGILNYTEKPVVSSDFIHDSASATYDATASIELNSTFFKLIAWYDNEWGYACRLAEMLKVVLRN